jgi:transcription elongation GreA/GreB family factor
MKRDKILILLKTLLNEEKIAKKRLSQARFIANESAKTAISSWSAAGERAHTEGQKKIIQDYYKKIKSLRKEIEKSSKEKPPEKIVKNCYVKFEMDNKIKQFYIVENPINVDKVSFMSLSSPLGQALSGKAKGESAVYTNSEGQKIQIKILSIE